MKKLSFLLATCCGAGLAPLAPGTAGAAVGLIPVLILCRWPIPYTIAALVLFFMGVRASTVMEGSLGEKDSPRIVIDEAVSIMITFAYLPLTGAVILVGFILNRFLDIVKPFPAGRVQTLKGGWGVMMDDFVSGVYSNLILRLIWILYLKI